MTEVVMERKWSPLRHGIPPVCEECKHVKLCPLIGEVYDFSKCPHRDDKDPPTQMEVV